MKHTSTVYQVAIGLTPGERSAVLHACGHDTRAAVDSLRRTLARLVGVRPEALKAVRTRGGTCVAVDAVSVWIPVAYRVDVRALAPVGRVAALIRKAWLGDCGIAVEPRKTYTDGRPPREVRVEKAAVVKRAERVANRGRSSAPSGALVDGRCAR